jgi:hypothetical protein
MLKTVSSVANALGALNYKGTWDAATNTPTLASGVGTQGDYYVVSVAGATDLDGITNWGVGDWATFNGSVWQRVEGGADGNFVNLTANEVEIGNGAIKLYRDVSNNAVIEDFAAGYLKLIGAGSIQLFSNTGEILAKFVANGQNEFYYNNLSRFKTTVGGVEVTDGDLKFANGHGIDFSATAGTGTSELLSDYEEGTWTPNISDAVTGGNVGGGFYDGRYTKVGNLVYVTGYMINGTTVGMTSGNDLYIQGLPFTSINEASLIVSGSVTTSAVTTTGNLTTNLLNNVTAFRISESVSGAAEDYLEVSNLSTGNSDLFFTFSYRAA